MSEDNLDVANTNEEQHGSGIEDSAPEQITKTEPSTDPSIATSNAEQQQSNENPHPKRKRAMITVLVLVLLLAVILGALFFLNKEDSEPAGSTQQGEEASQVNNIQVITDVSFADEYLPNFDDMRGYAEINDERWYASHNNIIISKNGAYEVISSIELNEAITSFTDIVNFNDKIWVAGQGGLVKIDESKNAEKLYAEGAANTDFFIDEFENEMYVTTFERGILKYDETSDDFLPVAEDSMPFDHTELSFSDDFVVAVNSNRATSEPVYVLDKSKNSWDSKSISVFNGDQFSSSNVSTLQVGELAIIYGRHKDYQSCEDSGSVAATKFFQLNENGDFSELSDLDELFFDNEAMSYAFSRTSLVGDASCEDGSSSFVVDLEVENGTVIANNRRDLDYSSSFSFYTLQDKVEQLEQEIGIANKIFLVGRNLSDKVASLWLSSRGEVGYVNSDSLANNINRKFTAQDPGAVFFEVECNQKTVVVESSSAQGGYNPDPFLITINELNNGQLAELYSADNEVLYEGVGAEFDLANHQPICIDGTVYMLGVDSLGRFDVETGSFTKTPFNGSTNINLSMVSEQGDMFYFVDTKNNTLATLADSVDELSTVDFDAGLFTFDFQESSALATVSSEEFVILENFDKEDGAKIVTFSLEDGSIVEETAINKPFHATARFNESEFILQYSDGETKIVNNKSHKGLTISKPSSILNTDFDGGFLEPITKTSGTFFVSEEDKVQFTSSWGIIGYQVTR